MNIKGSHILVPSLAAALLAATPAAAVTPIGSAASGLQAMRELNLIVLGNMSASDDVEGKTFVAGDMSGQAPLGIGRGSQGATPSARRTLTVGGNVTGSVTINNGSNGGNGPVATNPGVLVGGNVGTLNPNVNGMAVDIGGNLGSGNLNLSNGQVINVGGNIGANVGGTSGATLNVGGTVTGARNFNGATVNENLGAGWNAGSTAAVVGAEAATLAADVTALSAELRNLALGSNPSSFVTGSQGPIFNAVEGGNGYALFNVAGSVFNSGEIAFTQSGGPMPIIVNVSGTSINWTANAVGGFNASLNPFLIWNFYEATNINISRGTFGSILAPLATLANSTAIEGSIVVRNFTQGGEVHLGTYNGHGDFLDGPAPEGAIPEPASWAMLIAGFGLTGVALRRRRATTAGARA